MILARQVNGWLWLLLGCCGLMLLSARGFCHDLGDGAHITTLAEENSDEPYALRWNLEITVQELLARFHDYDIDENGRLTPEEYGAINAREVVAYVLPRLRIQADGQDCPISITAYNIITHGRGDFIQFPMVVGCDTGSYRLQVNYDLFFAENPYHQGTWTVVFQQQPLIQYFWEDERQRAFELRTRTTVQVVQEFLGKGIHHILIGFDHILFLVSLLLPAVLVRQNGRWLPVDTVAQALLNVGKIVTVFTLAHTVTLTLAVLQWVPLPPAIWVESLIALSIVIMAIHNIHPLFRFDVLLVTFAFGLVHGFGFANVLLEYPLSDSALVVSLVAFNGGVELGQLMIAGGLTPLLFFGRRYVWYGQRLLPLGSIVIALIGGGWFLERILALG